MERRPNLADKNPEKVAELQQRIESLAREGGQPLLMKEVKGVAWHVLTGSVATPILFLLAFSCPPPAIFPLLRSEDYGEDSAGFGERSRPTLKILEGWLALS